jgi:hypothetical protein
MTKHVKKSEEVDVEVDAKKPVLRYFPRPPDYCPVLVFVCLFIYFVFLF